MGAERPSRQGVSQSVEAIREAIPKFRTRWWQKQIDLIDSLVYDKKNPLRINYPVLRGILKDLGHDPKDMIEAWKESEVESALAQDTDPDAWADRCFGNLYAMINLEAEHSGSTVVLSRDFGIKAFDRYPHEVLAEQFRFRDNTEHPYGIVMAPRYDYNGAFYQDTDKIYDVWRSLHRTHLLRIIEVNNDKDIVKRIAALDSRYGPGNDGHKISFAIIAGHGHDYAIDFGAHAGGRIYAEDIVRHPRLRALGAYFEPGAPVVFNSCYAGVPFGMAETLTRTTGLDTVASSAEVSIDSIGVTLNNGTPVFDVKYVDGKRAKATRVFTAAR